MLGWIACAALRWSAVHAQPRDGGVDAVPRPLGCLARHYDGLPRFDHGQWWLVLSDGVRVPYDDGVARTFEQRLDHPDLEDTLSIPYRTAGIVPVTAVDDDPGRIRVDALFQSVYGHSSAQVRANLVSVSFLGQTLRVHRRVAPAFARVAARLAPALRADPSLAPFFHGLGGTFNWRDIAGTHRPSSHSYGVSLDLSTSLSYYWRWQRPASPVRWVNRTPQTIVDAFEAEGFIWGGRWYHYDTMHFEYRPELLDPRCAP